MKVGHGGDARQHRRATAIQLWMAVGACTPDWLPSPAMDSESPLCRVGVHAGTDVVDLTFYELDCVIPFVVP